MRDDASDPAAYVETLRRMGVEPRALVVDDAGTICASSTDSPEPLAELPLLGGADGDLRLLDALGEGGMGIVRSAEQRALQRQVAVKTARVARSRGGNGAVELMREARVTGALEHPNIVPVYALGRAADGEVLLVMKRIEGVSWASLLSKRVSPDDELRRHVDVLMDVCRAVEFAHARGILHRDLKPANVMVGGFGEVYVLDWGIATTLGATPVALSGTPAFMAPEMAMPGEVLDERSDVYLLGALLHVILAGGPPHGGRDVAETLQAAWRSAPPVLPDSAPRELADLCRRALARDRAQRPASAAAFRADLADFLEHASARSLADVATDQLHELERLLAAPTPDETAVYRAYSASRFGFEQALREWPGFAEAERGLRATKLCLARFEIKRRRPDRARALLDDAEPDADVLRELAALDATLDAEAHERERLVRLGRTYDLGASKRYVLAFALAVTPWLAFAFASGSLVRSGRVIIGTTTMAASNLVISLLFVGVAVWLRKGYPALARVTIVTIVALWSIAAMWATVGALSAPFITGFIVSHLSLAIVATAAGAFVRMRIIAIAAPLVVSIPLLFWWPAAAFEVNGVVVAMVAMLLAALWPRDVRPAPSLSNPA